VVRASLRRTLLGNIPLPAILALACAPEVVWIHRFLRIPPPVLVLKFRFHILMLHLQQCLNPVLVLSPPTPLTERWESNTGTNQPCASELKGGGDMIFPARYFSSRRSVPSIPAPKLI
jgi:hypothetical protein